MHRHGDTGMGVLDRHRRSHRVVVLRWAVGRVTVGRGLVEHGGLTWRDGTCVGCGWWHGNGVSKDALVGVAAVGEEATWDELGDLRGWETA